MELKQRKNIKNGMSAYDLGYDPYISNWLSKFGKSKVSGSPAMDSIIKSTRPSPNLNTNLIGYKPKPTGGNQSSSDGGGGADIAGIATGALNFTGAMMNSWGPVKSQNELLADAGTSNQSVMGVGYSAQNQVDQDKELKQLSAENTSNTLGAIGSGAALGGSIGSLFPGAGTVIGTGIGAVVGGIASIFGGKSRKRRLMKRIQNARDLASRTNNYKQASAMSTGLQQNYYLNNDYTQDDVLYG